MIKKIKESIIRKETLFFLMVIFSNVAIGEIGVTQFIYGFLAVYFVTKYGKTISDKQKFNYFLFSNIF